MKITVEIEIEDSRIDDMLVGAREGGSNHWASSKCYSVLPSHRRDALRLLEKEAWINKEYQMFQSFTDEEHIEHFITRDKVKRGLEVMADKYPLQFDYLVNENDDAETHDCFVQCCIFGELKYC